MRGRFLMIVFTALTAIGCSTEAEPDSGRVRPTLIMVDASEFVDSCKGDDPWRYVATLCDITEPTSSQSSAEFGLASSPPAACYQPVTFSYVTPGRRYLARVDGYQAPNVEPVVNGERLMRRSADGSEILAPNKVYVCNKPTLALNTLTRSVRGCVQVQSEPASGTLVKLAEVGTVPDACSEGPDGRRITTRDGSNEALEPIFPVDLNTTCVGLTVAGYAANEEKPKWTARCYAIAVENTIVTADCDAPKCADGS